MTAKFQYRKSFKKNLIKDNIESVVLIISYYKIMGVRPNFSQLAKGIGIEFELCKAQTPQAK